MALLDDLSFGKPLYSRVSPLKDEMNLHSALATNPVFIIYKRVSSYVLRHHGIHDNGLMVMINRIAEPYPGHVVVVAHQGSILLWHLLRQSNQWLLDPLQPGEAAIPLDLERFDRSGLIGLVVHAGHHPNKKRFKKAWAGDWTQLGSSLGGLLRASPA